MGFGNIVILTIIILQIYKHRTSFISPAFVPFFVPSFFLSTFLISAIARCFGLILYISCHSVRISHFPKEHCFLLWQGYLRIKIQVVGADSLLWSLFFKVVFILGMQWLLNIRKGINAVDNGNRLNRENTFSQDTE